MIDNNAVLHWEKKIKPRAFHQLLNAISEPGADVQSILYGYATAIGYTKRFVYFVSSWMWPGLYQESDFDKSMKMFAQILAE